MVVQSELNITDISIENALEEIMADSGVINFHAPIITVNSINNIKVQHREHIVDYTLVDFNTLCDDKEK